jgi:hypothetical protein
MSNDTKRDEALNFLAKWRIRVTNEKERKKGEEEIEVLPSEKEDAETIQCEKGRFILEDGYLKLKAD